MNTAPKTSLRLITSALALAAGLAISTVSGAAVAQPVTEIGYQRTNVARAPVRAGNEPISVQIDGEHFCFAPADVHAILDEEAASRQDAAQQLFNFFAFEGFCGRMGINMRAVVVAIHRQVAVPQGVVSMVEVTHLADRERRVFLITMTDFSRFAKVVEPGGDDA